MIEVHQHRSAGAADRGALAAADPALPAPGRLMRLKRQAGAIAIMFSLTLLFLLGFIGLALDLAILYNRKVELQSLADAAALAAASQLIGTRAGVQNAQTAAATAAAAAKYQYHQFSISWSDDALRFSASATAPESGWLDATAAQASPDGLLFARVDTSALDANLGKINTLFMRILSDAQATVSMAARAVAGRSTINVTPLAICALSATAANGRNNPGPPANVELEEYGFRRGVSYDLMNLNPGATTPENFVIDPIAPLGAAGPAGNVAAAVVGPFVCTGTMLKPRVMGGLLAVTRPFPIGTLFNQLNSRFDQYPAGLCSPNSAPPDANIRAYVFNTAAPWMVTPPAGQTATSSTQDGKLWTVASPLPAPGTNTANMYGPLWSFARAVPFSSYVAGTPEPSAGYATFGTAAWATLYRPGQPTATSYPGTTPYSAAAGVNFLAPSAANGPGVRFRRVLNVPLLACPVGAGASVTANVLAIGRFFMTVPATATTINAEFGGIVPEQSLGGTVELF